MLPGFKKIKFIIFQNRRWSVLRFPVLDYSGEGYRHSENLNYVFLRIMFGRNEFSKNKVHTMIHSGTI